jgi:FkbM family methyltransferase
LDKQIIEAKTILDIGGHIWLFSLYAIAKKFNLSANANENILDISWDYIEDEDFKIHYFEPVEDSCIKAHNILSAYLWSISINHVGISILNCTKDIYKSKISTQHSLYKSFLNKWYETEKCKFIKIGDYIRENSIGSVDIMKMDIEWEEMDVLLDLEDEMYSMIKVMFIEFHIFWDFSEIKFEKLLTKLNIHYIDIKIIRSKYDSRLWYILAKN